MSLFTRPFLVQHGVQRHRARVRAPEEAGLPAKGASLTGRCQPRFGVVFRYADDDNAASREKTVHSLLINMLLELGLEGYEVVRVGVQHFRAEGTAWRRRHPLLTGAEGQGSHPGHEAGLGVS